MKKISIFGVVILFSIISSNYLYSSTVVPPKQLSLESQPLENVSGGYKGIVLETMDSAGYTYILVDTGTDKVWAAAAQFKVDVGETVIIPKGLAMHNFHSKTLNKDFDLIYFVSSIAKETEGKSTGMPSHAIQDTPPNTTKFSAVEKASGGKNIDEIYSDKEQLAGKFIKVRGKVVKFAANIMGKNWVHLQDGSGSGNTSDLTVTTTDIASVGDTVLAKGMLAVDKDFGSGYRYDVILEGAQVTVE